MIALGGDGTFNEVVNGMRPGVVMGVLPGGRVVGVRPPARLPDDPVGAATLLAGARSLAAASGRVGLGVADGRRFTFAASVGFDATATRAVDEARHERPAATSAR